MVLMDWNNAGVSTPILNLGYSLCYFVSEEGFDFFLQRSSGDILQCVLFKFGYMFYVSEST